MQLAPPKSPNSGRGQPKTTKKNTQFLKVDVEPQKKTWGTYCKDSIKGHRSLDFVFVFLAQLLYILLAMDVLLLWVLCTWIFAHWFWEAQRVNNILVHQSWPLHLIACHKQYDIAIYSTLDFQDHIWYILDHTRITRTYRGFARTYWDFDSNIVATLSDHTGRYRKAILGQNSSLPFRSHLRPILWSWGSNLELEICWLALEPFPSNPVMWAKPATIYLPLGKPSMLIAWYESCIFGCLCWPTGSWRTYQCQAPQSPALHCFKLVWD